MVPLVTTFPDFKGDPWGGNGNTLGLTPDQLLNDLRAVFEGEFPDCRDDWHSDPHKMPDKVMRLLPQSVMVFAKLDILYDSQITFTRRLLAQAVHVDWIEVPGLHQVKDMDRVTEAGRTVRQYIRQKSSEFVRSVRRSAILQDMAAPKAMTIASILNV